MNIMHEKTGELLPAFLEQIKPKSQTWRLISIEFQDCETLHSSLFQNLCLKNLDTFFSDTDCKIFWHKPGFLLIFFQGRAMPIEKCVESFLKETEFKGFGRFFDILDLSIHWDNLMTLTHRIFSTAISKVSERPTPLSPATIAPLPANLEIATSSGFTIELSKEHIESMEVTRAGRKRPLLLLVEDDPFTLQLVKLAVKEQYDVITAETARQALVYYQRHLPDMVFLDIQLPDGNGINLLEQMKAADRLAHIVMLSSHSQKERILECQNLGAKGFIAKPFTRQRLIDATEKFRISKKSA